MDYKKTKAPNTTITRDLNDLDGATNNIYQTVMVAKVVQYIGWRRLSCCSDCYGSLQEGKSDKRGDEAGAEQKTGGICFIYR